MTSMPRPRYYYAVLDFDPESQDSLQALIDFLAETDGPVNILLDSAGGYTHSAMWLLDILNNPFNVNRVTLTAGHVRSAGAMVWLGFKGRVATTRISGMMVHQSSTEISMRDGGRPHKTASRLHEEIGRRTTWLSEDLVLRFLSEDLRTAYLHQHDVLVGPETLDQICKTKNQEYELAQSTRESPDGAPKKRERPGT